MEYSYRFRIYPTKEQKELIQRTFGCCRFVYNRFLAMRIAIYKETGTTMNYYSCSNALTPMKKDLEWLKDVDATALQSSLRDLDAAFQNFFRGLKQGQQIGFPKFKSKRDQRKSYKSKNNDRNIAIVGNRVKLPKLGLVKCAVSKEVKGRILSVTVSQNPSDKYFVSICCTDVEIEPLPSTGKVAGADLGIKTLAVMSDGVEYPNNKYLYQNDKKLRRLARQVSRKKKGGKNYEKACIRKARLEEKIANQRRDTIQKATTDMIRRYDVICLENLKTKGMMQNHKFARSIGDASFYEFRRELEYKAAWYGKTIVVIDTFFPSSQLCHVCGCRNPETKSLTVREWICPKCGTHLDRDKNAAINILDEGMRLMA